MTPTPHTKIEPNRLSRSWDAEARSARAHVQRYPIHDLCLKSVTTAGRPAGRSYSGFPLFSVELAQPSASLVISMVILNLPPYASHQGQSCKLLRKHGRSFLYSWWGGCPTNFEVRPTNFVLCHTNFWEIQWLSGSKTVVSHLSHAKLSHL